MKPRKLWERIEAGEVRNLRFEDLRRLVEQFGFELTRVRGSHHIFTHPGVAEPINLQNVRGEAKPYQIRQFLRVVRSNGLVLEVR